MSLDKQSDNLRDAMQDYSLQIMYERQVGLLKERSGFEKSLTVNGAAPFLKHTVSQIGFVHCYLSRTLTRSYEGAVRPILDRLDSLQAQTIGGDDGQLLRIIQVLAEDYFTAATSSVQQHLAEARRIGKQQELIQRWRTQMLQCASVESAGAGGAAIEEPPAAPTRSPKGPESSSDETEVKTWIEIRLVDPDGRPVRSARYKIVLPDGSIQEGRLDNSGKARFESISPGNCKVTFPEIDGSEWQKI